MKLGRLNISWENRGVTEADIEAGYVAFRRGEVQAGEAQSATIEACCQFWERGLALARADNAPVYVDGAFFAAAGRDLATFGRTTWAAIDGGLYRCERADKMRGGWDVMLAARSSYDAAEHMRLLGDEVLHVAINAPRNRPWEGRAPSELASDTVELDAAIDRGAASMMNADYTGGAMMIAPGKIPAEAKAGMEESLTRRLQKGPGKLLIGENMNPDGAKWEYFDLSPDTRRAILHEAIPTTTARLFLAYGIPALLSNHATGSAALREGMRAFYFGVLAPLARLLEAELRRVFGDPVRVDPSDYLSADLAGRARSIKALTEAGVPLGYALAAAGFVELHEAVRIAEAANAGN